MKKSLPYTLHSSTMAASSSPMSLGYVFQDNPPLPLPFPSPPPPSLLPGILLHGSSRVITATFSRLHTSRHPPPPPPPHHERGDIPETLISNTCSTEPRRQVIRRVDAILARRGDEEIQEAPGPDEEGERCYRQKGLRTTTHFFSDGEMYGAE